MIVQGVVCRAFILKHIIFAVITVISAHVIMFSYLLILYVRVLLVNLTWDGPLYLRRGLSLSFLINIVSLFF